MTGALSHQQVAGAGGCLSPASALLLEAGLTGAPTPGLRKVQSPEHQSHVCHSPRVP